MSTGEKFRRLLREDDRYLPEAYNFVYEALDYTLKHVVDRGGKARHVSGPELLEGIRRYSIEQFGCLARPVLESWGVRSTGDFGEIVFNLVRHDLMGKQDSDRLEDFQGVYEFAEAFDVIPLFHYSREQDEWHANYVPRSEVARAGG